VSLSIAGREVSSVIAGDDGSFVASITVPRDAPIGRTQVRATAPSLQLEAAFEVLGSSQTAAAAASSSRSGGVLSRTGADIEALASVGALLVMVGATIVIIVRRRRSVLPA
jgi:hypothetical protein